MKYTILILLCTYSFMFAQSVQFVATYNGFDRPVDIAVAGDGSNRLFVVEQEGRILIIEDGIVNTTPFLDIRSEVQCCGERGLLGLVFHPDYENNGFFFVNYIDNNRNTVIARFEVSANPNIADASTEKQMIKFFQPYGNHNGGDLNFGPFDGLLYVALGDGGSSGDPGCRAQDLSTFMGKMLRIDVDVNVNTSPYYGIPNGNLQDEIWASGLRNPWRFSFDRETGDLWIADVGQGLWEEVNFIASTNAGNPNFGWKRMEGLACYSGGSAGCGSNTIPVCNSDDYFDPIYVMAHRSDENDTSVDKANSITGGFVYRGCKYPDLKGKYICTDYVTANSFLIDANGSTFAFTGAPEQVTSFGEDEAGELWVASLNGVIYRVVDANVPDQLIIKTSDFPLSGVYSAAQEIVIEDALQQDLSGVSLISPILTLLDDVLIPDGSGLQIMKDHCQE